MPREFKGLIDLNIRKSKPDWEAFLDTRAPKDAPNVLVILYDDTGQAAWSPYGGRISMPTMDRLAKNGLTYTQWHTTSVCSPMEHVLGRQEPQRARRCVRHRREQEALASGSRLRPLLRLHRR
jgi:sulfatase-like protein